MSCKSGIKKEGRKKDGREKGISSGLYAGSHVGRLEFGDGEGCVRVRVCSTGKLQPDNERTGSLSSLLSPRLLPQRITHVNLSVSG
jgi:hypothetical protein